MARLLFLAHRLPYPPDKGDKVRSYHLLQHLLRQHEVHVGTFVDDPADEPHVPALRAHCASLRAVPLNPRRARVASLAALARREPLTLAYYRSAALQRWVIDTCRRADIDAIIVFSSSMAQYAAAVPEVPAILDLVDVDSAKWAEYAPRHAWPMSWLYRREARTLLAYERKAASASRHCFLATEKEADLFRRLAPECADRVAAMNNGVDAEFFAPSSERPSPFAADEQAIVFTGAMDYWPNIDAVVWFVREMLPGIRARHPNARFHIVGRSPHSDVRALAGEAVNVTGTVADVRPYLQHAAVVVAPLRLARGIQNKILEAMAMRRAVVAAGACVGALHVQAGSEILSAEAAGDYVELVSELLADPHRVQGLGARARARVLADYAWAPALRVLDTAVQALPHRTTRAGVPTLSIMGEAH